MKATEQRYYSPEEYLALEIAAEYKSEYIDGQILPMAGGSTNHNRIAGNFYTALNWAFKNQDFEVFISDVRLWIPEYRIYTYPDVMVVVGKPEYFNQHQDTITNPQVIIEVLSKSTQECDRSSKFRAYRTIPTFQEYLLLDQNKVYVEHFFKTGARSWSLREYDRLDEAIALSSISLCMSLIDVYNKVQL
jgi:Uma2 family endonuclease